jgi:uncharacterized protein YkwD
MNLTILISIILISIVLIVLTILIISNSSGTTTNSSGTNTNSSGTNTNSSGTTTNSSGNEKKLNLDTGSNFSIDERDKMLNLHNDYRKKFGSQTMTWDNDVAAAAQEWANNLDNRDCIMEHPKESDGKAYTYGQNLALFMGSSGTPEKCFEYNNMGGWGPPECKKYDFKNPTHENTKGLGHFTQVVWNGSTKLGCGKVLCKNGSTELWVCNYLPEGNMWYNGTDPKFYLENVKGDTSLCDL